MSYIERRKEITARALAMSTPNETLAEVWSENPELALDMAEVVNHTPTLERALTSGVFRLQVQAVASSSLRHLDLTVLVNVLGQLPMDVRRVLFNRIRSQRLTNFAEALIGPVHAVWGATEAARILPLCGAATIEQWLPKLEHAVVPVAIAKRHPQLALDHAFDELGQLEAHARDNWWRRKGSAIDKLVEHDPVRVLDLTERFGPSSWLPFSTTSMTILAKTDAGRFLRQLERLGYRPGLELGRPVYRALAAANPPELVSLGRHKLFEVLRALPPSRRVELLDLVNADKDMSRADLGHDVLRLLPRARRAAEARRMIAMAVETGDEVKQRTLTAFLPFDEAKDLLTKLTHSGEATERAEGYPLLIDCAARDFRLAELLPWLADRLKREQDPVRLAAIQAMAEAHPQALGEAGELTPIASDAFDARDFSQATGHAIATICVRLLVHNGSTVALGILADWWARTKWSTLGELGVQLRHGQEHDVFRSLRPTIAAATDRADFGPLLALVAAFGRRAWQMPDLLDLLWTAVEYGYEYESRRAIGLLLDDLRVRDERVQRVLDIEPSAVYLESVLHVVTSSRTDLLELVLGERTPVGRFAPKDVRRISMSPFRRTRRWLPRQRVRYAELVMNLADDARQTRETRASAVRTLGLIHGPAKREVQRYLESPDELIAQAAIGALPEADDPAETLDLLLARALSDNRGQAELVSMYTVRRCARRVAPGVLPEKLVVEGGRVTVRKEIVRLISDFRIPGAVGLLHRIWSAENQHRDVRATCVFAALSWLDDPAAWGLLRAAVQGPREIAMQTLRATPWDVPSEHRAGVAALIHKVAEGDDNRLRTQALAALGDWGSWYPEAIPVLRAAATDLDERAGWLSAAAALAHLAFVPAGEAAVIEALHALLSADDPDADADRDRPGLQRARRLVRQLGMGVNTDSPRREVILRVTDELHRHDEFRTEATVLRVSTVRAKTAAAADDLRDIERWVAGRPVIASRVGGQLGYPPFAWDADAMLTAARGLTDGHLQAGVVKAGGPHFGWPSPWRELLKGLRRHADPSVRDAALAQTTAAE